jgi:hypothetical protein
VVQPANCSFHKVWDLGKPKIKARRLFETQHDTAPSGARVDDSSHAGGAHR